MTNIVKFKSQLTQSFTYENEMLAKQDMLAAVKQKVTDNIRANATGLLKDVVDANLVSKIFDKGYEQRYLDIATAKMMQDMNSRSSDFLFGATSKAELKKGIENDNLGYLIKEINQMVQVLKPHNGLNNIALAESVNIQTSKKFFSSLAIWFSQFGTAYETYAENCRLVSQQLGVVSVESAVEKISGALNSIVGSGLWERVSAEAKKEVLEEKHDEIMKLIKEAFANSNFIVNENTFLKFDVKHTGQNTNNGKAIVADSMIVVSLVNTKGKVIASVGFNDSTKYTSKNNFLKITPTSSFVERNEEAEKDKTIPLSEALRAIKLYEYWYERLQPYLEDVYPNNVYARTDGVDGNNWTITKQLIYAHYLYDVIAMRASTKLGEYADTFSLNNKSQNIVKMISNYWDYLGDVGPKTLKGLEGISSSRKGIASNIFTGYDKLVRRQGNVKNNKEKDSIQSNNFETFWDKKEQIKVKISINAFKAF